MLCLKFRRSENTGSKKSKKNKKMTPEQQEVLNAVKKMTKAFEEKDIDTVMLSYEANATVVFEPGQPISDNDTIRKMFIEMSAISPKFTYSGHEVIVTGDIATHIAPWQMQATTPDGTAIKQSGLSVAILRKQKNNSWLMVIDNPHGQNLLNQ